MRLQYLFSRLPLLFDIGRLQEELQHVPVSDWRPHPSGFAGNSSLILISSKGEQNDDHEGPMRPTPWLERFEYLQQVLASFETVFGRARFMRLEGGEKVNAHVDINTYWATRVRVHVPLVTSPDIRFICHGHEVHMAAGEAWVFDAAKIHTVINPSDSPRVHLVADTMGSGAFWKMCERGQRITPEGETIEATASPKKIVHTPGLKPDLKLESFIDVPVLPPGEVFMLTEDFIEELHDYPALEQSAVEQATSIARAFVRDWRVQYALHGESDQGVSVLRATAREARNAMDSLENSLRTEDSNMPAMNAIFAKRVISGCLSPELFDSTHTPHAARVSQAGTGHATKEQGLPSRSQAQPSGVNTKRRGQLLQRPVIILAPPRSGSTMLFELLTQLPQMWTIGGESHRVFESVDSLGIAANGYESNRLAAKHATPDVSNAVRAGFVRQIRNREGKLWATMAPSKRPETITLLEKTPKNALRIPFIQALFPDARFIVLIRDPLPNVASIVEAWRSQRFVTYPQLPGWTDSDQAPESLHWSLLLPPGWREQRGKSIHELAVWQWCTTVKQMLEDLAAVDPQNRTLIQYTDLTKDTLSTLDRIADFLGTSADKQSREYASGDIPHSKFTLEPPSEEKWKKHEPELSAHTQDLIDLNQRVRALFEV